MISEIQRGEKSEKKPREAHREALSLDEYNRLTHSGLRRLDRPRPVWLPRKKCWTVGAPVNPIEWQILIQSKSIRDQKKRITRDRIVQSIMPVCGSFWLCSNTFYECLNRLSDKHLLKGSGEAVKIVDKWLHPDLTGQRAGGEWHQKSIHKFVSLVNRVYGCYTYVDRGFYPGVQIPDVIVIRPELVEHTKYSEPHVEPIEWDLWNPIYAEFKSSGDMREHLNRFERQLNQYDGIPLYLQVEARVNEARDMLEDRGRREVDLIKLLEKPAGDKVSLYGSERPYAEQSFDPVIEKIKNAFMETYDRKARLKKTGTDPQGRECHDLILYDASGTAKNIGQVIPNYARDVEDFAEHFFGEFYLGRITTADYIYKPERKPTPENKTWKWVKRKTTGAKFRSFRV